MLESRDIHTGKLHEPIQITEWEIRLFLEVVGE
jgi:hypothetical protein